MLPISAVLAVLVLCAVWADPIIGYPFNNQLPPVARYGQSYTYTLNSDTFRSSNPMTLTAENMPAWMSFDGSSWTISGTPPISDASQGDKKIIFNILASDSEGRVNATCSLEIISAPAPQVGVSESLTTVLSAAGPIADSQSVVLTPGSPFEINFPNGYFSSDGREVVGHYAVTSEHAPLPIWLSFDGARGKFTGTAPSVTSDIAPSIAYTVLYIVSTVAGFSTAQSEFRLLLGANSLTTNTTTVQNTVHAGVYFDYQIPFSFVSANGETLVPADISSISVSIPSNQTSWLSYSESNYTLSGIPPTEIGNTTIDVPTKVCATFGDCVSFTVQFSVQSNSTIAIFTSSSWPPQNVTANSWFSYSVGDYLVSKDVSITATIPDTANWLNYNAGNYTLGGFVPSNFNGSTIAFTGTSSNGGASEVASLRLLKAVAHQTISSVSSSSSATSTSEPSSSSTTSSRSSDAVTSSATPTIAPLSNKSSSNNKAVAIACGVAIPLGVIAIVALLLFFFWRRRHQANGRADLERNRNGSFSSGGPGGMTPASKYAVSSPIAPSNGVRMAPVFKTATASDEEDDDTVVETPTMPPKTNEPQDWSTPQRVSAYNFMRMDGSSDTGSNAHHSELDETPSPNVPSGPAGSAAGGAATVAGAAVGAAGAGASAAAGRTKSLAKQKGPGSAGGLAGSLVARFRSPKLDSSKPEDHASFEPITVTSAGGATARASEATSKYSNVPRESWRHTNLTNRRWQDSRESYASCASIPVLEAVTMQAAHDGEDDPSAAGAGAGAGSAAGAAGQKCISREMSSGNVRYLNSDAESSSPESGHRDAFDEAAEDAALAADAHRSLRRDNSNTSSSEDHDDSYSVMFRENSDRSLEIRAYRNTDGDLQWNETQLSDRAKLVDSSVQRKPSEMGHHKVPSGEAGEIAFV